MKLILTYFVKYQKSRQQFQLERFLLRFLLAKKCSTRFCIQLRFLVGISYLPSHEFLNTQTGVDAEVKDPGCCL